MYRRVGTSSAGLIAPGVAWVEASAHRHGALPPSIGKEPLQHVIERTMPGRNLDDFADIACLYIVEVPPDRPVAPVEHGARAQRSMPFLAGPAWSSNQASERASLHRLQAALPKTPAGRSTSWPGRAHPRQLGPFQKKTCWGPSGPR